MSVDAFTVLVDEPFADGEAFGQVGSYRRILARATYVVDPLAQANARIVDLEHAPRNADGRVEFSGDVEILTPSDPAQRTGPLLVDVPNRGNRLATPSFNRVVAIQPEDRLKAGDGWLFRRGYTVASVGWQFDASGPHALSLDPPEARPGGKPVSGDVLLEFRPGEDCPEFRLVQLGTENPTYPVHDLDDPAATLTVRRYEDDDPVLVPRADWQFARERDGSSEPSAKHVALNGGFRKGLIYQLTYRSEGAPVVGTGLLAVRDVASCLCHGDPASPLGAGVGPAIGFGVSQTGRFLRQFVYEGLNRDEAGRVVFDGLFIHIAGAQRGDFNHRFAQPTVATVPSLGQRFPFAGQSRRDPVDGTEDGLFARAEADGSLPRTVFTNTSWEYWRGDASLAHADKVDGVDLVSHPRARYWLFAGTHHIGGLLIGGKTIRALPLGERMAMPLNVVDSRPLVRAALDNLERWVTDEVEPPPSQVPRLDDGTAVARAAVLDQFARFPGVTLLDPEKLSRLRHLDAGPGAGAGIVTHPIVEGAEYPAFVAAVDDDGNEQAGIRLPDITVPVATHTGWNPRDAETGGGDLAAIFAGFTHFFPRDEATAAPGDPRVSLPSRYAGRDDYAERVAVAAAALVADGYLLAEDSDWVIKNCLARFDAALTGGT